ncbi:MAG: FAD:protein FMN transferase [Flavobacteriales bacterium]
MRQFFFLFFMVIQVLSCKPDTTSAVSLQGNAFGTTYHIQVYNNSTISNKNLQKGVDSVIYSINKSVSTYLANSLISKINQGDTTVVVDAIFKEIFKVSELIYKNSSCYFDPTIGVLRNAYGFGDVKPISKIDSKTLDSLRQFVGFNKISISPKGKVTKQHPETYIDFNAIAKGYGLDAISTYLNSLDLKNYLIELGGEIVAKGSNLEKNKPWLVGIESPQSNLYDRTITTKVALQDIALASSGNYRKFRIDPLTGKKYVHTINPITGLAEANDVLAATVLASNCTLADGYATACMALGLEGSKKMLNSVNGIEAYLIYTSHNGNLEVFMTDGFKEYLVP